MSSYMYYWTRGEYKTHDGDSICFSCLYIYKNMYWEALWFYEIKSIILMCDWNGFYWFSYWIVKCRVSFDFDCEEFNGFLKLFWFVIWKDLMLSLLVLINEVMSLWFFIDLWIWEFCSFSTHLDIGFLFGWELKNFYWLNCEEIFYWFGFEEVDDFIIELIWEFKKFYYWDCCDDCDVLCD